MKKKINVRNKRGSISLFVLLSILFFLVVVTSVATNAKNKEAKLNSEIVQVKAIYEKDIGNEKSIYAEKIKNLQNSSNVHLTVNPNKGTWRNSTGTTIINKGEQTELTLEAPTPPSVTFNLDGGTIQGEQETISFTGWELQQGSAGELSGSTYTFGDSNATIKAIYNKTSITLPNATKSGFIFAGWYNGSTKAGNAGDSYTPQGAVNLTAHWTQQQVIVAKLTIDPAEGTISVKSPESADAEEISESKTYTQEASTTLKYEIPTKADTQDTSTKYTVTYNTDGGSTAPASQDATITKVTGYTFDEWIKSSGFKGTLNETTRIYTYPADNNNTDTITATYTSSIKSTTVASVTLGVAPTKEGYDFVGWKSSTNNETYNAGASYTPTANTTMTAQWTAATYTISYAGMDGATHGTNHPTSGTYNENVEISNPTKDGYTFAGWTSNAGAGLNTTTAKRGTTTTPNTDWDGTATTDTYFKNLTSAGETITLTATWTVNNYDIKWLNGDILDRNKIAIQSGTVVTNNNGIYTVTADGSWEGIYILPDNFEVGKTYVLSYKIRKTAGTLLNIGGHCEGATQRLFTIDGVSIETNYGNSSSNNINITNDTNTHSIVFEFTFNGNKSNNNIYIQPNRGNATSVTVEISEIEFYEVVKSEQKPYGTPIGETPTVERTGYTLSGWYTDKTSGTQVTEATTVPVNGAKYYAHWTENIYTVTVDAGEGTIPETTGWTVAAGGATATKDVIHGNTYGTLPEPTKAGCTFNGWYTGQNGTGNHIESSDTVTANTTLYADWTGATYTVTYNKNADDATGSMEDGSAIYNTYFTPAANGFTRTGYTFTGWNTESNGSGTVWTAGTPSQYTTQGNITLYAQWQLSTYTITLNNQSATSAGTEKIYETYGTKYSLTSGGEAMTTSTNGITVPTRTSYAFGGYYTERNGEGTQIIDANGFLTAGASTTQFENDGTLYAKWTDSVNPTLSTSIETYHEGFEDWELSGGAYIDGNGTLWLPNSESVAKSRHYQAEAAWYVMYDAYTTTAVSGTKGGSYFKSEYYDSTLTNINNKDGVASNDWKNTSLTLSEWTNLSFSSTNKMYGGNIKYITLQFEENNSYGKTPEKIKNFKVRGQLWSGFYDIKITASDGQSGLNTIKYALGNRNADYFATEGIAVSNNVIRVTENGKYTVCAEDKAGNRTIKTVTISKIDKTGPSNTAPTYTKTANSITVTNSQADSESGIYKVEYAIKESGGEYGDWQSSNEFTGLRSSTTYVVKTRAINKAYLKSESSETTVTTDTIEYTITLDDQGATTPGTGSIYEIYENRYSLASGGVAMTSSINPITKPEKTGSVFTGYYTEQNGAGTQIIDANGYLTSVASNTLFTSHDTIYANWSVNQYMVTFDARGGTSSEQTRPVTYNSALVTLPTAEYTNHIFKGWYTEPSGGTQISESTTITGTVTFYAQWEDAVAKIGGVYYTTLTAAVAAVTTSTPTTIILVANTSENITISASQDITFDFGTNTLSNNGANIVIDNNGTLTFASGTITTNANQIAVNNNSGATLYITGGTIEATGTEQAVYNNGGTVEISGGHISAIAKYENSNKRATVHNQSGTMVITGGTIVAPYKNAPSGNYDTGTAVTTKVTTLTVGVKDGQINTTSPEIVGERFGINNEVAFNIYDGNIKGKNGTTAALVSYAANKIGDKETNYKISHETVDSYDCVFFVATHTVKFNANGGTVATSSKTIEERKPLGTLPTPTRAGYAFRGWFTEKTYGEQVTAETLMGNDDITYYAHWEASPPAEVDGQQYNTVADAISKNDSGVEIEVIADATESITIPANKEVTINLNGHTLSNNGTSILKNNGNLTITGGCLDTNRADASSIDNNPGGTLILDGVRIVALGTDDGAKNKQAVYNDNGTVTIKGNSYLESKSSGAYNNVPRSTAHNINGGTMIIESATIINNIPLTLTPSSQNAAVSNGPGSTLIVGIKEGLYNQNDPTFIGRKYGIYNAGTLKYYDGTFSGTTASIYSTVAATSEIEDYHDPDDTTEEITLEGETQSATYHKRFLLAPITITPSTLEPEFAPITATIRYNSIIVSGMKAGFGATLAEAEANASAGTANSVTITGNGYIYAEGIDSDGETRIKTLQITNIIE